MKVKNKSVTLMKVILVFFLSSTLFSGCTEQYVMQTNTFEDILVVNAIITNELRLQEIKLNRTYRLEEDKTPFEKGANVYVTDSDNIVYEFEEDTDSYISKSEFKAEAGKTYQLNIITKDGKSYSSTPETLTAESEVKVTPTVLIIDGQKGVQIDISSFDPTSQSKFYRYEYDETYKIVAPKWSPYRHDVAPFMTPDGNPDFILVPRVGETKTCYTTKKLDDLLLKSTVGLTEDRIDFPIRFISVIDPIIRERYSIVVRQYVQNLASYTYYKTLKDLSISKSILSQTQTGFNYGNIKSNDNVAEKIVGYFEVSSVSSQRIYFNFRDLFPKETYYPPYFIDCPEEELVNCWGGGCGGPKILSYVKSVSFIYYSRVGDHYSPSRNTDYPLYFFVPAKCGDCTKFSSNLKPLFWID